mmetsp:Transcript_20014/g.59629  ORF Transcript_20014/g.59629 Transcript_20014/m.59629 type:complete len:431 (+) Transcript_20014:476-1768(+)
MRIGEGAGRGLLRLRGGARREQRVVGVVLPKVAAHVEVALAAAPGAVAVVGGVLDQPRRGPAREAPAVEGARAVVATDQVAAAAAGLAAVEVLAAVVHGHAAGREALVRVLARLEQRPGQRHEPPGVGVVRLVHVAVHVERVRVREAEERARGLGHELHLAGGHVAAVRAQHRAALEGRGLREGLGGGLQPERQVEVGHALHHEAPAAPRVPAAREGRPDRRGHPRVLGRRAVQVRADGLGAVVEGRREPEVHAPPHVVRLRAGPAHHGRQRRVPGPAERGRAARAGAPARLVLDLRGQRVVDGARRVSRARRRVVLHHVRVGVHEAGEEDAPAAVGAGAREALRDSFDLVAPDLDVARHETLGVRVLRVLLEERRRNLDVAEHVAATEGRQQLELEAQREVRAAGDAAEEHAGRDGRAHACQRGLLSAF